MKNAIFLVTGLVITVLYIVFSMQIYELLYYETEFSQAMYDENMYLAVALITAIVAWAAAAIYYYGINSVSFARWYHWLAVLGVTAVLAPTVDFVYPDSVFAEYDYEYTSEYNGGGSAFHHRLVLNKMVEQQLQAHADTAVRHG